MTAMRTITAILGIALLGTACEGFLDVEPQDEISREEALDNIENVRIAMIGAYSALANSNYYRRNFPLYPETVGHIQPSPNASDLEDFLSGGLTNTAVNTYVEANYRTFNANYENSQLGAFYEVGYGLLRRANDLIEAIPRLERGSPEELNSLLGEALALRAIGHFDLLRLFAQPPNFTPDASHPGIVLLDRPLSVFESPGRSTVAACYALIVSDLEQAIELIGPDARRTNERIWLSPQLASGLLARVEAYRGNWERVVELASPVIEDPAYGLIDTENYLDAWLSRDLFPEAIMAVDFQQGSAEGINSYAAVIGAAVEEEELDDEPVCRISNDLLALFAEEDIRLGLFEGNGAGDTLSLKYPLERDVVTDFPLLRLAELDLLRAEAYANIGQEAAARADYDIVHQRALPGAEPTVLSGQALLDEIFAERRRELHLEGHLLFDLARTGRDIDRDFCLPANPNCLLAYPDFRYILPIPLEALEANPNLTQNEGY